VLLLACLLVASCGDARDGERVTVRGTVQQPNACRTLRSDSGRTFALLGPRARAARDGARVEVTGTAFAHSKCQLPAIRVERLRPLEPAG
jgi:hypothetical protein